MSMPNIPTITPVTGLDETQVALLVLASIGLEEIGLSHILNAEGEKIQFVLGTLPQAGGGTSTAGTVEQVLEVNKSVRKTLEAVIAKELILNMKFDKVLDVLEYAMPAAPPAAPTGP